MDDISLFRPTSLRGWLMSSLISMGISKLAAAPVAKYSAKGILMTGLLFIPPNQVANELTSILISFMQVPAAVQVAVAHPKETVARVTAPALRVVRAAELAVSEPTTQDLTPTFANKLNLHSFEKEYRCVFSGKVTCGDGLCQTGEVKIHVESKKNSPIIRTAMIQPDGSYEVSFLLREDLHENLDWWIIGDSPESASKQIQGREILTEDLMVSIEEPLQLL